MKRNRLLQTDRLLPTRTRRSGSAGDRFRLAAAIDRDPAVREEWEALQAWDRKLGEAITADVSVPHGLAGRLLDGVRESAEREQRPSQTARGCSPADVAEEGAALDDSPTVAIRPRQHRRWWWPAAAAAALVAAAVLVAVVVWFGNWSDSLTGIQVAESARLAARTHDPRRRLAPAAATHRSVPARSVAPLPCRAVAAVPRPGRHPGRGLRRGTAAGPRRWPTCWSSAPLRAASCLPSRRRFPTRPPETCASASGKTPTACTC